MRIALVLISVMLVAGDTFSQEVFINELHYDNSGGDVGEFVEIAGPANTSLSSYELVFYNGANTRAYKSVGLEGVIPNEEASGFGALAFMIRGIQNGAPDGIALIKDGDVVQFISYEGDFRAGDGPAADMLSSDISVRETSSTPSGSSLQLSGKGAGYGDFRWAFPREESPGRINEGQFFLGNGQPMIGFSVDPHRFFEDDGDRAATARLILTPAPDEQTRVVLTAEPATARITYPQELTVMPSGVVEFPVGVISDGIATGIQTVRLTAVDPAGIYQPSTTEVTVFDVDPPVARGVAIRVACYNLKYGAGARGSVQYQAVLSVLRRVDPDVIIFSEADPDGDFANLRSLIEDMGMSTQPGYFTTAGDAFSAVDYDSGDFGSGQALAVASIWPMTSAVQIGRGDPGRRELARFPLFVEVDVPGVEKDPAFVAVHLKAGNTDADNFRRAVEALRVREFLEANGYSGTDDNVFVLGDLNEDFEDLLPGSYTSGIDSLTHVFEDGSILPASYILGSDIAPPNGRLLEYRNFPAPAFEPAGLRIIDSRQLDGTRRTYNVMGDSRIDYILVSDFTAANAQVKTEVYNSVLDFSHDGLPKSGGIPDGGASYIASDHHLVFGDFVLEPAPQILVSLAPQEINGGSPELLTGSVEVVPVAQQEVRVALFADRSRLDLPRHLIVPAGGGMVDFQFSGVNDGRIAPDRTLRISGHAPGHASGHGFVRLTGDRASGQVLISQYVEPPSGGSPKAIELVNNTGEVINFKQTPLDVFWAPNGREQNIPILVLASGILDPGAVLVMGGEEVAGYLVGEGLLGQWNGAFSDLDDGHPFYDPEGRVRFIKKEFYFNGDDALVVKLGSVLADTFGVPGEDPGSQWSGSGVSSANQNIALRNDVATGSAGSNDPSLRFFKVGRGDELTGFGLAPSLMDDYMAWASSLGLAGIDAAPSADPEHDGFTNLLEYALGGEPLFFDAGMDIHPVILSVLGAKYSAIEFPRLLEIGRLQYLVEKSVDLVNWSAAGEVLHDRVAGQDVRTERVTYRLKEPLADQPVFLRLLVLLP